MGAESSRMINMVQGFGNESVEEVSLEDIFQDSDVCTIHIPLTEETNGWVNDAFFSSFRKAIYFLNLSRGPIVDLESLIQAVESGQVSGAALDVLEK